MTVAARLAARPRVASWPFPHLRYAPGDLLSQAEAETLSAEFPSAALTDSARRGPGKSYQVRVLPLHGEDGWRAGALGQLSPGWRALARRLVTPEHLRPVCDHLGLTACGVTPASLWIELRPAEYVAGGWMSRHTDRADKAFSQVLYFCPGWRPGWGGGLAMYHSQHAKRPAVLVEPGAGNAVAFARSDESWHEVLPVSEQALTPRRTLLLHAYHRSPRPGSGHGGSA